jgi:lipopolysaccharide biosynthesis regulator YciM
MEELDSAIPEMWRKLNISSISAEDPLRFHFRKNLEPSETLSNSLRADLTHIHPTVPVEELKPQNFYRGYDKGSSAVSSNFDVSRDVTSDLILDLIDTQNVIGGSFHLLRGPAGSGKTIALKRIAWDVAADFEGVVFWIEETGILKANVVNEICELLGKKVYLIIDKASTRLEEIISVLTEARIKKLPVSIIAAERDHIWNIESGDFDQNWKTKSFQIGQLRPTEIKELLGKLKKYSALGVLSHLNFIEQQEAFNNADRHLLVALHEVTLGKAFEEIILDEYEGLKPDKAKRLYLDICTLNQFGAPVRAGIINRITSIPFSMFRKEFILPLDNVVLTSENRYTGDMQYSARHSRIASLVFKLAFSKDEQRVEHLVRLGSCLDEGFKADRFALSELINARNLCALISDIECGRSLYDQFRDLLGDRWYLFHQRANFELQHKNGSFDEAETYGQLALELEPERSSILHVLAEVSRARAKKEDNVNRKNIYRQQARDRVSNMHGDRSKFADSTRCKLRLDEMRDSLKELAEEDIQSIENFSVRTNLAREILDKAKYKYPTDPDIIRLEADFYSMLREDSKAIRALERAYQLKKSNGPNIPLQLTRMYHKSGDIEKAREVLENEIANSPNNTSLNYELAKHIIEYDEIIAKAVYYIGRSYNSSDRNYTARFLHAQLTFLLGDSEKSKELFQEVDQIAPFDFKQKNKAGNPSKISRKLGRLQGRIIKIEKTYCFVKCSKYPNNIYANRVDSNYDNWGSLNPSKSITFEVRFNRSGPIAVDICC